MGSQEISLHQLAGGQFSIGRTTTVAEAEALKNNSLNPSQIFEHLEDLNEEITESYGQQVIKDNKPATNVPVKSEAKQIVKKKRDLNPSNKQEEKKPVINQVVREIKTKEVKMDLEKELNDLASSVKEEQNAEQDQRAQLMSMISKLPSPPSENQINAWKREHGKDGVHITVFSPNEIYIYRHLSAAAWKQVRSTIELLQAKKENATEEDVKEKVVQYCMLWPALTLEWKHTARAGVVNALYESIMLNSYFLTPAQIMAITTEL